MPDPIKSAVVIAQLLDCEGFSDHTANAVKRYWWRNCCKPHAQARLAKVRRAFSEMVKAKLSDTDRIVLGRMIGLLSKMQFDTGLRVGLTAFLHGARIDDAPQPP